MITTNPPNWTIRTIKTNYDKIKARAKQNNLPMPYTKVAELGTGHYGCVFKTGKPGIVFKITSDPTEARFISILKHLEKTEDLELDGIVKYFKIYQVVGTRFGQPIFIIWREEVKTPIDFSLIIPSENDYLKREFGKFWDYMWKFFSFSICIRKTAIEKIRISRKEYFKFAQKELEKIDNQESLSGDYFGYNINQCIDIAENLQTNHYSCLIGEVFAEFLSRDLLLADVHFDNIGLMLPYFRKYCVENIPIILDPGHLVMLTDKYFDIRPERI